MRPSLPAPVLLHGVAAAVLALLATPVRAASTRFEEARIPHQDGSGRATIVEIDPELPGAMRFLRATPEPVPRPGELVVPPRATPEPSPSATGGQPRSF